MRDRRIVVDDIAEPEPGAGEVLVRTLACGICGSDLHMLQHAHTMAALAEEMGAPSAMDPNCDVVMGHEFCAEIVDFGPDTLGTLSKGDRVCALPVVFRPAKGRGGGPFSPPGVEAVGYSNQVPGGYGELMVLTELLLIRVSDALPSEAAALTEPMAVGIHAVAKAKIAKGDAPLVIGCGPVGLAVIAGLRLQGVEPIVASDYSPRRRDLARVMGAHAVLDPAQEMPFERLAKEAAGRTAVVFECVGVPGVIQQLMRDAPPAARIVVAGVCMESDAIRPIFGIQKELEIQFVLAYTPQEFAEAHAALTEGRIDGGPLITGQIGLDGVAAAFDALGNPEAHAKIIVEPGRGG